MQISIIVAVSQNGVIGKDNQLIWRLPDDLKRFKSLTLGHPMIMGRKTYDSIGKPLPGRTSIVVSRNSNLSIEGVLVANTFEEALEKAAFTGTDEVFVIGGGNIYEQSLQLADKIYLTDVHTVIDGDTFFYIPDKAGWTEVAHTNHPADERHAFAFDFIDLEKP